jgi:hypothetical protein
MVPAIRSMAECNPTRFHSEITENRQREVWQKVRIFSVVIGKIIMSMFPMAHVTGVSGEE